MEAPIETIFNSTPVTVIGQTAKWIIAIAKFPFMQTVSITTFLSTLSEVAKQVGVEVTYPNAPKDNPRRPNFAEAKIGNAVVDTAMFEEGSWSNTPPCFHVACSPFDDDEHQIQMWFKRDGMVDVINPCGGFGSLLKHVGLMPTDGTLENFESDTWQEGYDVLAKIVKIELGGIPHLPDPQT